MNRRLFLSTLAAGLAGATLDPEKLLWTPGKKLISIPAPQKLLGPLPYWYTVYYSPRSPLGWDIHTTVSREWFAGAMPSTQRDTETGRLLSNPPAGFKQTSPMYLSLYSSYEESPA